MSTATRAVILSIFYLFIVTLTILPYATKHLPAKKATQPSSYLTSDLAAKRPVILCHRGSRYMVPENTIHAMKWAIDMGCDVLETDVRLTKDNKLVHAHDDLVDRVTNMKGAVKDYTYEQIKAMDWAYHLANDANEYPFRSGGFYPPLFSELMDAFPGQFMNIEIKENDNSVAEMVWKELNTRKAGPNVVVSSRWCEVLTHFRKISEGTIATGACESEGLLLVLLSRLGLAKLYFYFVQPTAQVYQMPITTAGIRIASSQIVETAHSLGQKIQFWVLNSAEDINSAIDTGCDGFVTDRTDLADGVLVARGVKAQSSLAQIDRALHNTPTSFYIPKVSPNEIHQCVSAACRVLPYIFDWLEVWLCGAVGVICFILLLLTSGIKDTFPARIGGAANGKKQKKH